MQLPAGYCPEPHQQQQSADDRVGRNAAPAGQHAGQAVSQQAGQTAPVNGQTAAAHSWRLSTTNVLPMGPTGIRLSLEHSVAESITLRGPRGLRGPISTTAAAEALDAVLRSEPHRRCVMHRCITPMPLAMPLPFPGIFSPQVSPAGDIITTWAQQQQQQQQEGRVGGSGVNGHNAVSNLSGAGRHPGSHVSTSPVLARLVNSSEFDQVLVHASDALGRASGSASGRALLDAWGYSAADVDDLRERVQELASRYREGESDDEF
eukprot:jgi/Chrzof1/11665/Cz06g04100.t1